MTGSVAFNAPETAQSTSRQTTLSPIVAGFDLTSVRCAAERRLDEAIRKDEKLTEHFKAAKSEVEHARAKHRLSLMTQGYRVDEAITPKLSRLSTVLSRALRLVHPLDVFVWPSHEHNAYCLPSRKGNRLVMCLYSGLVSSLSSQELLFVMGHEVGHAILKHGETLGIGFDNPHFSPLEVVKVRALERAHEISCDRFGLLACQDIRTASATLFKIASGLSERWISFDETAYSRHFDELSSMSELIDIENAASTHPLTPLRVKALIAFAKSDGYASAFGRDGARLPAGEMEHTIDSMLSVLDPDVSEFEGRDEQEAANHFLIDGAILIIGADGVVSPDESAWLKGRVSNNVSAETLAKDLSNPQFQQELQQRLQDNAVVLRNKLSEVTRARLLHTMCEVALTGGGIPDAEYETLNHLRQLLKIPMEVAQSVLNNAKSDAENEKEDEQEATGSSQPTATPPQDALETVVRQAKLPEKATAEANGMCQNIRSSNVPIQVGIRTLVSWAIGASRANGSLSEAQGKKLAIAAVKVCREMGDRSGSRKLRSAATDKLIRQYGLVALFSRNETVFLGAGDRPYAVLSVSRAKGTIVIAPADNMNETLEVDARELRKDPVEGGWPAELEG